MLIELEESIYGWQAEIQKWHARRSWHKRKQFTSWLSGTIKRRQDPGKERHPSGSCVKCSSSSWDGKSATSAARIQTPSENSTPEHIIALRGNNLDA